MNHQEIEAEIKRQAARLTSKDQNPTAVRLGRAEYAVLTQAGIKDSITVGVPTPSFRGSPSSNPPPTPIVPHTLRIIPTDADQGIEVLPED